MFRFRFRLITLFAVMSILAIGAAAYGMYQRTILAEHKALTKIGNKGAFIYIYGGDGKRAGWMFFPDPKKPEIGVCGTGLVAVYGPAGAPADFSDADLKLFDDVRTKLSIKFKGSRASPAAIEKFKQQ